MTKRKNPFNPPKKGSITGNYLSSNLLWMGVKESPGFFEYSNAKNERHDRHSGLFQSIPVPKKNYKGFHFYRFTVYP